MSAFDLVQVVITRPGDRKKTTSLGYTDTGPVEIPGSPFTARYFRKKQAFNQRERDVSEAGTSTVQFQHVLSILDANADIRANDFAHMPAGTIASRPVMATIVQTRLYSTGLQCDMKTVDEGKP